MGSVDAGSRRIHGGLSCGIFPTGRFDLLRLGVDLVLARDDRLPISELNSTGEAAGMERCDDKDVHVQTWPIVAGSTLERLTTADREVVLGRVVSDPDRDGTWWPAVPYLQYQVQYEGHPCDHLFRGGSGLESKSMAGVAGAMAEKPIPPELAPPRN